MTLKTAMEAVSKIAPNRACIITHEGYTARTQVGSQYFSFHFSLTLFRPDSMGVDIQQKHATLKGAVQAVKEHVAMKSK